MTNNSSTMPRWLVALLNPIAIGALSIKIKNLLKSGCQI
jgi:hypothetical protein